MQYRRACFQRYPKFPATEILRRGMLGVNYFQSNVHELQKTNISAHCDIVALNMQVVVVVLFFFFKVHFHLCCVSLVSG